MKGYSLKRQLDREADEEYRPRTPKSVSRKHGHSQTNRINSDQRDANVDSKNPKSKQKNLITIEDDNESSDDELALMASTKKRQLNLRAVKDAIKAMNKLSSLLSSLGGIQELESYIENFGIQDDGVIDEIRKEFSAVDNDSSQTPSTADHYNQLFLYPSKNKLLYLLQPVHVFAVNKSYARHKTFGLVRRDENSPPLMCTISGEVNCAEAHSLLLNPELWTQQVLQFASEHGHKFQTGRYDKLHGKVNGFYHASHVEPRLMLWFACYLANMLLKTAEMVDWNDEDFVKVIWKLKDFKNLSAEIMISHSNKKACNSCIKFKNFIEQYTGIRFNIISCPNLGELQMRRCSNTGNNQVPSHASDSEWEKDSNGSGDGDDLEDNENCDENYDNYDYNRNQNYNYNTPPSSSLQVVIRSNPPSSRATITSELSISAKHRPFQSQALQKAYEMREAKRTSKSKNRNHERERELEVEESPLARKRQKDRYY